MHWLVLARASRPGGLDTLLVLALRLVPQKALLQLLQPLLLHLQVGHRLLDLAVAGPVCLLRMRRLARQRPRLLRWMLMFQRLRRLGLLPGHLLFLSGQLLAFQLQFQLLLSLLLLLLLPGLLQQGLLLGHLLFLGGQLLPFQLQFQLLLSLLLLLIPGLLQQGLLLQRRLLGRQRLLGLRLGRADAFGDTPPEARKDPWSLRGRSLGALLPARCLCGGLLLLPLRLQLLLLLRHLGCHGLLLLLLLLPLLLLPLQLQLLLLLLSL
jgi:hypothetical protein